VTGEEEARVVLVSTTRDGQPVTQVVSPDGFQGTNATGQARGSMRLTGDMSVTSQEAMFVGGVEFGGDAVLYSRSDVGVRDADFDGFLTILGRGDVGLSDVEVAEATLVRVLGNATVSDSTFNDEFRVGLGPDDSELAVGGSTFDVLVADGGRGDNTFDDRGGNVTGDLQLRRFGEEEDDDEG
jgi:hypothetical protein